MFSMAWSPVRRTNAGRFEVDHPGDDATLNSYHPVDGTGALSRPLQRKSPTEAGLSGGRNVGSSKPTSPTLQQTMSKIGRTRRGALLWCISGRQEFWKLLSRKLRRNELFEARICKARGSSLRAC